MTGSDLTVTWRLPGRLKDRAAWQPLIDDFKSVLLHPERAELVITDQYQAVAGEYEVRSPVRANTSMTAEDYRAMKTDGSMAVARTIELPGKKAAVVASAALPTLGPVEAKRILRHEAQHVSQDQEGTSAWGVHRRIDLDRPADIGWDFIWTAESAIGEFRCERALNEAGMPPSMTASVPTDYPGIVRTFHDVRDMYYRTGDLVAAYQAAFASLERLANFLAYGAAHAVVDSATMAAWSSVRPMTLFMDVASGLPAAHILIEDSQLMESCIEMARVLRRLMRKYGFDSPPQDDGSIYFELLR